MLTLDTTTQSIECIVAAPTTTNPIQFWASYTDTTTTAFTPKSFRLSNSGTTVTLVAAPAASTQRRVTNILVYNGDTAATTVTLQRDEAASNFIIGTWTLQPGESLQWTQANGFFTTDASGARKTALVASSTSAVVSIRNTAILNADVSNSTTSASNGLLMSFPVTAGGTYSFQGLLLFTAAATTTGIMVDFTGPTTSIAATAVNVTTTSSTLSMRAVDSLSAGTAFVSSAFTAANLARFHGMFTATADGILQVRFASEVASSAIVVKAGSQLEWIRAL